MVVVVLGFRNIYVRLVERFFKVEKRGLGSLFFFLFLGNIRGIRVLRKKGSL